MAGILGAQASTSRSGAATARTPSALGRGLFAVDTSGPLGVRLAGRIAGTAVSEPPGVRRKGHLRPVGSVAPVTAILPLSVASHRHGR